MQALVVQTDVERVAHDRVARDLLRQCRAQQVFAVSLAGMAITFLHNYALSDGIRIMGGGAVVFSAVIFSIGGALLFYARLMLRAKVLR